MLSRCARVGGCLSGVEVGRPKAKSWRSSSRSELSRALHTRHWHSLGMDGLMTVRIAMGEDGIRLTELREFTEVVDQVERFCQK